MSLTMTSSPIVVLLREVPSTACRVLVVTDLDLHLYNVILQACPQESTWRHKVEGRLKVQLPLRCSRTSDRCAWHAGSIACTWKLERSGPSALPPHIAVRRSEGNLNQLDHLHSYSRPVYVPPYRIPAMLIARSMHMAFFVSDFAVRMRKPERSQGRVPLDRSPKIA